MIEVHVQKKQYEISVDRAKNRIYLKVIGFWRTKKEVADYVPDLKKVLQTVQPNITLLTDLTEMRTHPAELREVHMEAQHVLINFGLVQTAEVCSSIIVQAQANNLSRSSKMPLRQFTNREEAENYLDSIEL